MFKKFKIRRIATLLIIFLGGTAIIAAYSPTEEEIAQQKLARKLENRVSLSKVLTDYAKQNKWPENIDFKFDGIQDNYQIQYTLEPYLQTEANRLLSAYKPDYGAIFLMDANTGKVLAMSSFQKGAPNHENLNLRASYPAASVFKIVTATAAMDKAGVTPHHNIKFNGGNYTLYRRNVMSEKITRWTRTVTLKEAFARSLNTAFGRLSLETLNPEDINHYANKFMFNQEIPTDFAVEMGVAVVPNEKGFALTEVASGYNKLNRMSPVQGAMIAAAVINDGKILMPYVVDQIKSSKNEIVYRGEELDNGQIMESETANKVKELMEETIISGTSRKTFRSLVHNKKYREIEMGGKTGHLTGNDPKGRVDWFVGYARDDIRRIAVAAITVNEKYWTVKSSHLGQSMFKKYFEPVIQSDVAKR